MRDAHVDWLHKERQKLIEFNRAAAVGVSAHAFEVKGGENLQSRSTLTNISIRCSRHSMTMTFLNANSNSSWVTRSDAW